MKTFDRLGAFVATHQPGRWVLSTAALSAFLFVLSDHDLRVAAAAALVFWCWEHSSGGVTAASPASRAEAGDSHQRRWPR